ncbi:restriction endonuclease [Nonomuraea sp. NPDC050680]|uniref:restriction endonuclease n=1 Tax=Nonomuraea sp. NPDC050680 TaxID=3154630 RepID=UPI00340DC0F8
MLGGTQRYESALRQAEAEFAQAQADHQHQETQRQKQVIERRRARQQQVAEAERAANEFNARLDAMEAGLRVGDRHAVSDYMNMVLRASLYPEGFPTERMTGYVPESSLLAVEWYLPPPEIIPEQKLYKHVKTRKAIEPTPRPTLEARQIYQRVIAQIALRTLREIFDADPGQLITTIVFNGLVRTVDPATGQQIEPYLITLRATREQFADLVLTEPRFKPVECVRRHFHADVSQHPDELVPVEPVMHFSMADPRIVDPIDIISDIDKRPNLLDLSPKEFEAFIQNLFARMGFDTKLYQASGDGGVDCVAYDPDPIKGGKFIVQAKLYTQTVKPTHVRDLYGTVQHEGATKGIMITTSGYGPESYKFAARVTSTSSTARGCSPSATSTISPLASSAEERKSPDHYHLRVMPGGRGARSPLNRHAAYHDAPPRQGLSAQPWTMCGPSLALIERLSCIAPGQRHVSE